MDRRSKRRIQLRLRLPRARGDGPEAGVTYQYSRLPRARGDGPDFWSRFVSCFRASPRTRGWTPSVLSRLKPERGFPAHAGMDPRSTFSRRAQERLPRARGDGPTSPHCEVEPVVASPRTRGWTRIVAGKHVFYTGFPAHAGMDPLKRPHECLGRWLPRARGDGPLRLATPSQNQAASPRTRGWTQRSGREVLNQWGFPAHAGMDQAHDADGRAGLGLPRARGDGPSVTAFSA